MRQTFPPVERDSMDLDDLRHEVRHAMVAAAMGLLKRGVRAVKSSASGPVFSGEIVRRSLCVAVVVGTVLNLINQGDALIAGDDINFFKVGLNYVVPFFVSIYGAYCFCKVVEH